MINLDNELQDDELQEGEAMPEGEAAPSEEELLLQAQLLDSLSQAIAARRKEAIEWRAQSGIEQDWMEDEEFYLGIDDGNRHEHANSATKPLEGGSSPVRRDPKRYGSTVVPNITGPYVDAAAARIGDMLLPTDDRNFALDPTPIPDMGDAMRALPNADPVALQAKYDKVKADAKRRADKAQTRIDDWMVECDYHGELREVIDDCARIGSGVIRGPIPVKRKNKKWIQAADVAELQIQEVIAPESRRMSAWDLFPDKNCGDDIHRGDYIFERDRLSETKVQELNGQPGYLEGQLKRVIEQGPMRHTAAGNFLAKDQDSKDLFEVWYYYGIIKREELEAANCPCGKDGEAEYAVITMINDVVVKATLNPMSEGSFPYDVIPWKKRKNSPFGVGVAREIRTPQRMVTAATRNLMNNAGLSSGPQIIMRKSGLTPKDGKWEIVPQKIWLADDDADVTKAFMAVQFPMIIAELERIIQMGLKFAEDVTGLPMLLQGQQGKAPDTVGGMTMLNNNATSVLRRIARLFDSKITEPHVTRYYDYLMEHGTDPEEKGDLRVNARGSSALVERDIQSQEMIQILQMAGDPGFGWSKKRAGEEYLKSRRFDPAAFALSEEEMAEMAQQPPPTPPVIEVANIRAQNALEVAKIKADTDLKTDASDTDRDLVYSQAEMARVDKEHEARMAELAVKERIAMLDYANKRGLNLDKVKADLAKTSAKIKSTERLAAMGAAANMMPKPPVEPPGKAPAGQSFQR